MSVIIGAVSTGAYVDNVQRPGALGEMHPPVIRGISLSVLELSRHAGVPGCHKRYGDICASGRGVQGARCDPQRRSLAYKAAGWLLNAAAAWIASFPLINTGRGRLPLPEINRRAL